MSRALDRAGVCGLFSDAMRLLSRVITQYGYFIIIIVFRKNNNLTVSPTTVNSAM